MNRWMIFAAILPVAACTATPSAHEAMANLNHRYDGHPFEEFSKLYGEPARFEQSGSTTIYRWVSVDPAPLGSTSSPPATVSARGKLVFIKPQPSQDLRYCVIRIKVNKKGITQNFSMAHDAPGRYANSLCAEIFGSSP